MQGMLSNLENQISYTFATVSIILLQDVPKEMPPTVFNGMTTLAFVEVSIFCSE
jgi:hypothetical protein